MTAPAGVRETHTAVLWFMGDRVHKLKKPVALDFCDFTTVAARREACEREVALNARLSPEAYLGVETLLGPDGAIVDHLVLMRRMPAERSLASLVRAGAHVDDELRAVARRLTTFHSAALRGPHVTREGRVDALRRRWRGVLDGLHRHSGQLVDDDDVDSVTGLATRFLAGRAALFDERCDAGRIVDGHGDLLADDVFCLRMGPVLLDCLEFDDRLRYLDTLDDAAFLAMDLEHQSGPALGERFLELYAEFSGDRWPVALGHHYRAYRAATRSAVAAVRASQGGPGADEARDLLGLARRHLEAGQVRLILVGGLPGTGKTTVAVGLADRLGAVVVSTDPLRKELAGISPADSAAAGYGEGLYDDDHTAATYAAARERADVLLARGESVVLDASWTDAAERDRATDLARAAHAQLTCLECRAPREITEPRIRSRRGSASDATPLVAAVMSLDADPWPEAIVIDTAGPAGPAIERAVDEVHHPTTRSGWTVLGR
ncbi:AAA family ATPase [Actinomycetospora endophytica]|uniref:AAA family ATPase n=1 Tax=Actinomycetospora endophytica TaxID=2291215 RepID=A0ABS8PAH0_9PSEU|nr:AAA family ATPase [Actinomycetospora endophytica]MCD2195267.1 AAA family ATPase [Actinomycetospora endophytica]